ncbi:hypothetical protein H6P81_011690 [Aristolochia fimbriata]|uniref:Methyltransferase type 11 domain-containing protein n=1 Tax=Aristolochia fimbriata TaxID=158543 RepID=A0AAV7ECV4_ARIFI|nr:hypothetical protein H6P81_011690 [Aristolochia fimbriata]
MACKVTELQALRAVLLRRFLLRTFMLLSALALFPFMQFVARIDTLDFVATNFSACASKPTFFGRYLKPLTLYPVPLIASPTVGDAPCQADINVTSDLFRDLLGMKLLTSGAKALCLGDRSSPAVSALRNLGFPNVFIFTQSPFTSHRSLFNKLNFDDNSFDFVYSSGLHEVSVPALLVLEIERVLKPGGIGAMLVGAADPTPGTLIKAATPISSYLRSSEIVHVGLVHSFTLVVFKKANGFSSLEHYPLPRGCPSVANNKPYIDSLETLSEENRMGTESNITFLTQLMNITERNRLIYIDVGAGRFADSSIAKLFLPRYPKQSRPFNIYALEHESALLSSYAGRHDVTFVYYPELSENWADMDSTPFEETDPSFVDVEEPELFDFIGWLRETVTPGDFVVVKMSAGGLGQRLLHELFESGSICLVDELFLQCTNRADVHNARGGDCSQLFKTIRNKGVFVHQWME